jgi:hypothetical protein
MEEAITLAYYDAATNMDVKSFNVHAPSDFFIEVVASISSSSSSSSSSMV